VSQCKIKPLVWVASSKKDLKNFPEEVQRNVGYALFRAQEGKIHIHAKPLKGFGGNSVVEIVENEESSTYRAVYTVKFESAVYVLHAFQKKSHKGIKTPQHEIDLIKQRLKEALDHYSRSKKEGLIRRTHEK